MASNLKTKKFTSQFERWVGTPPAGCRFLFNDAVTGKPYWITREDFLNGFNGTSDSGASAYQIYAATTSDNPVLSEIDWIYSLHGHDGITPTIGSNGHWFIGTVDTGIKAEPENPIPAAQIYNAPMGAIVFYVGLLSSLSDSWHLANGEYVEGYGYTEDWRGKVAVGYDDRKAATPTSNPGMVENYGAIGNTGGKNFYKLTGAQSGLKKHFHYIFKQITISANNFLRDNKEKTATTDGASHYSDNNNMYAIQYTDQPADAGKSSEVGDTSATEDHDNRMEYVVGAYIQRVKPEVVSGGGGTISSTETAPYVLSGLDADITLGQKVSHTPLETHSFTADDISLESTAAPTDFAIEVDVQKNGVSIFTTRPKINAGSLKMTVAPVLVTSTTTFIGGEDIRTVSVEAIGTTETGKDLVLSILMHK
jgi:microcystin-dependent protein